jgi:uncharacterized Zn-binding protein involved in type VI secretion
MRDVRGREMVRLGDTTDHGGVMIEAAGDLTHVGRCVALDGQLVMCLMCRGPFPIIATGDRIHRGIRVAFLGDRTACGTAPMRA